MAKDLEKGVDKMIEALSTDFDTYNEKGSDLPKATAKFWKKIKKRLSDDIATSFEKSPAEKSTDLKTELMTLGENQRIQMNYAIYLHEKGISLEE